MEIVCPCWCPEAATIEEALPILADQGVTAVELALNYPPDFFDFRDLNSVNRLVKGLDSTPIQVSSVHAPFGPALDLSSFDDRVHERGVEAQIEAMELAKLLGAKAVVIHASDGGINSADRLRRLDRASGVIRELAGVAKESGIALAIENLPPGYLGCQPEEVLWLMEQSRSEWVTVCFDTGHANLSKNFLHQAETLLPQSSLAHLHDNDGTSDQHKFPGLGNINWAEFGRVFRASGGVARPMLECALPHGLLWRDAIFSLKQRMSRSAG